MSRRPLLTCAAALLLASLPATAYVPGATTIANAVAKANRASGRAKPLILDVDLRMGEDDVVVATGRLLSDPSGMARLELRSGRGATERHLLRGAGLEATRLEPGRQGRQLDRPRPFLPPFFLLQAGTASGVQGGLVDLGTRVGQVALGYDGEHDCFVIGGRDRAGEPPLPRAALWIDQESLEVVRIDLPGGARYRLGPPRTFGKLRVPSWIEIYAGDVRIGRLSVRRAATTRPAPGSFSPGWLMQPPADAAP